MLYIYSGPTLDEVTIKSILPKARILPPIKAADLLTLLKSSSNERPTHVHIIDGLFYSTLSVRHKEILHLIGQGITVSGSSSMGALRASELHEYGMLGIGRVYKYYTNVPYAADDEVAISHLPDPPYTSVTIPMINIRFTLEDLVIQSVLSLEKADMILSELSLLHFSDRTNIAIDNLPSVVKYCPFLSKSIVDWKRKDAIESLLYLSDNLTSVESLSKLNSSLELSPGTNLLNYFVDTCFEPNSVSLDSIKSQELTLFNSFNLQSALLLCDQIHICPTNEQIESCMNYVKICTSDNHHNIFLNDKVITRRYSILLAKLLILHVSLDNHSGLFGHEKMIEEYLALSSLFAISNRSKLKDLMALLFSGNSFPY